LSSIPSKLDKTVDDVVPAEDKSFLADGDRVEEQPLYELRAAVALIRINLDDGQGHHQEPPFGPRASIAEGVRF